MKTTYNKLILGLFVITLFGQVVRAQTNAPRQPFRIRIVDEENNWPVPLIELKTIHQVRFVSDNNGQVAFDLPELMGVETWLSVEGHGYHVPADGFGMRGVRVLPGYGETAIIKVKRTMPAKRLGRITGAGIFSESQKLGEETEWREQGILGCDSVQNVVHNDRLFWGWGDTLLPNYPLGRFHMTGATTDQNPLKTLKPPVKLRYDYFGDKDDVPRNVAKIEGPGPTWLSGYASLPDASGKMHLVATYSKIKPPLTEYERGLCVWNEKTNEFEKLKTIWQYGDGNPNPPTTPTGHPVITLDNQSRRWIYFGDPFPSMRCRATYEDWSTPESWESLSPQDSVLNRDQTQKIKVHRGAIAWSEFRKKWVCVFTQLNGNNSVLGELWYAESEHPTGPWKDAIHIVSHHQYSFYNPQLHMEFTPTRSPSLIFEATYTSTFSKTQSQTARHGYNQILYRLDLDELDFDGPDFR